MSPHLTDVAARRAAKLTVRRPRRREADPLFRREMRERWRRPLTLLQLFIFASALAWIGYNIYYTTVPLGEWVEVAQLAGKGREFFFSLAHWHALAWIPGGLLLAAPTLAAERERGNLTDWILAGLSPAGIVRAKWRALAGFVLVMVCVPFPIFALCFPIGGVSPLDFAATFVLTVSIALSSVALGLLISANCASVMGALWGALAVSGIGLLAGVPLLFRFLEESWLAPLIVAFTLGWLTIIWVSAARGSFEVQVETHIKDDKSQFEPYIVTPPPAFSGPIVEIVENEVEIETVSTVPPTAATPEFSQTETLLLRASLNNAIAHRDVKRRLASRRIDSLYPETEAPNTALWLWILLWFSVGVSGLVTFKLANISATKDGFLQGISFVVLVAAMGYAAMGAAPGFTRERQQKMLSALQMTALSPLDIVWGKVAGVLLLCAQYFGGALFSLCTMALFVGPLSALALAFFGVSCVVFTAMGSLTLSLWSRKTEIVALGSLAAIAGLWWVLPMLYIGNNFSLYFHAPRWLELLWLAPMRALMRPASDVQFALALAQLSALCVGATLLMIFLCVLQLRRTRAEEEDAGWLQRDLSRGWK